MIKFNRWFNVSKAPKNLETHKNLRKLHFILFISCFPDYIVCQHCTIPIPKCTEIILEHSKKCLLVNREDSNHSFTCLLCAYHTFMKNDMRCHVRSHIGDKPYKCSLCTYSCAIKGNLKKHAQIRHGYY